MKNIKVLILQMRLTTGQALSIQGHKEVNRREQPDQQVSCNLDVDALYFRSTCRSRIKSQVSGHHGDLGYKSLREEGKTHLRKARAQQSAVDHATPRKPPGSRPSAGRGLRT